MPQYCQPNVGTADGTENNPTINNGGFAQVAVRTACSNCAARSLCLPQGLSDHDVARLQAEIRFARRLRRGEVLYRAGDAANFLYAVRGGSLNATLSLDNGVEQVVGICLPGEVTGLDGMAMDTHVTSVVALEDASICAISYEAIRRLCRESSQIQLRMHRLLSERIVRQARHLTVLGSFALEERVAAFLLDISIRQQERGYSRTDFVLRMSRAEIGSYLGGTIESVSRAFSGFQKRGLIMVRGKHVVILDMAGLRQRFGAADGFVRKGMSLPVADATIHF